MKVKGICASAALLVFGLLTAAAASAQQSSYYSGSGGSGSSIAILPLEGVGLAADLAYLPALVQGEFVSSFSKYSAIKVFDRLALESQYKELLSGYYPDDAEGIITLGHLPPTTYLMMGKITKTASGYALQITIAKNADGATAASYSGACTVAELDNFTGIRRASLELLGKMGVTLTEKSKTELAGAAAQQAVNAQTALAQGITAQRSGTEVAALSYYYQAAAFDPSLLEAANRVSTMTVNITSKPIASGNIGQDARNQLAWYRADQEWKNAWIARLTETEQYFDNFFKTSSPPFILYYATALEQGSINFQAETLPLSFDINLHTPSVWFTAVEKALQVIADGLNDTGRKQDWGEVNGWPGRNLTSLNAFGERRKDFAVVFELVNEENRVIGTQTVTIGSRWRFSFWNGVRIEYSADNVQKVTFNSVKIDDITDRLTIRVAGVNGADPQTGAQRNSLQIISVAGGRNTHLRISNGVLQGFVAGRENPNLVIADSLKPGERVTSIGREAFKDNKLTSVTIPNSVISIGEWAFANNQLTNVTIPNSVTYIGDFAFYNNPLRGQTIPSSVTYIGRYVFDRDAYIGGVLIPATVTSLEDRMFHNKLSGSVVIPNWITSIGNSAFAGNQLTSVTIPNSVTSIGDAAFYGNQLTSVTIPNSVTSIGNSAFAGNWLTSVTIPNSVTSIGNSAFASNQLTSVTISNSVTSIGNSAFAGNQLTSVTIPNSVTSIGNYSFNNGFEGYYNSNGKKAGTYTRPNASSTEWRFSPR